MADAKHKPSSGINDLADYLAAQNVATGRNQTRPGQILYGTEWVNAPSEVVMLTRFAIYHADDLLLGNAGSLEKNIDSLHLGQGEHKLRYDCLVALSKMPDYTASDGKELDFQHIRIFAMDVLGLFMRDATDDRAAVIDGAVGDVFLQALKKCKDDDWTDDAPVSVALNGIMGLIDLHPDIFKPIGPEIVETIVEGFMTVLGSLHPGIHSMYGDGRDVLDQINKIPDLKYLITKDAAEIIAGQTPARMVANNLQRPIP